MAMVDQQFDISQDLTPAFFNDKSIKKGSVLIFDYEGSKLHMKIVRLNRSKRICIVEEVKLYTADEINDMPREEAEEIIKNGS